MEALPPFDLQGEVSQQWLHRTQWNRPVCGCHLLVVTTRSFLPAGHTFPAGLEDTETLRPTARPRLTRWVTSCQGRHHAGSCARATAWLRLSIGWPFCPALPALSRSSPEQRATVRHLKKALTGILGGCSVPTLITVFHGVHIC